MAAATAFLRIDQAAPVGPQVYEVLRAQIIRSELPPATRLSETEIANAYGISRQPVREAFIKLAEEGLVEVRPQRGSFITKISEAAVMDARFVREAVESDIVRLLARERDDRLMAELEAQLDEQRAAAGRDADRFIRLDEGFHRLLARACGKAQVWRLIEGLKVQMDRVRYLSLLQHFPMEQLLAQHEAVAAAIGDRDEDAAEAAMRGHLRQILEDLPLIAQACPDFFDKPPAA